MSSVSILNASKTNLIKEFTEEKSDTFCTKCGDELYTKADTAAKTEQRRTIKSMQRLIKVIPVISAQQPLNWDYNIVSMVTGQSTTGTGVITEFTSSFTDLFGSQSGRTNSKLKAGDVLCFSQIRTQALNSGANAVIATDIDYSEVGGGRGMLMVCMTGTAIKLNNLEVLGEERA